MAGRGPQPKPAHLRQRTNRKPGSATITRGDGSKARVPELYDRPCPRIADHLEPEEPQPSGKRKRGRPKKPRPACEVCQGTGVAPWHPRTVAWWREAWKSELALQYLEVDRWWLRRTAALIDRYEWAVDHGDKVLDLAKEIRMALVPFGQNPGDRARLGWEVEQPKPEESKAAGADEVDETTYDSRDVLRALK